ncbi:hypothetical protein QGN23_11665 [Chryseobacterium gotjawalense]|uniref:NVEALA protein n=1 Tax=Chryseobacterium gotjawalense TaxID=3042315 RepID=A0ABY8RDF9_9FLAO|nr:hypothetical protein [Chryseobacterium sp. wdc7]WHF51082.1 hypothetical protein QGN23_11665 [Chryseobacterium sp. wdc7]
MKKLLLLAAFGVAGMMSASNTEIANEGTTIVLASRTCVGVESDCGGGGIWFACGEKNSDGELDHEVVDEMRQNLNEAFCGYGE